MKIYVQNNSFKMVGKVKEIRAMLREYSQHFTTVNDLIEKNNNTYTYVTASTNKMPKRTQYYLLIPQKK